MAFQGWVSHLLIAQLLTSSALCQQTVYSSCIDTHKKESTYQLSCHGQGQIVDINYTSGKGTCKRNECLGESAESMINIMNCYWAPFCLIQISQDKIVKSWDSALSCIGQDIGFIRMNSYRCFDTSTGPILDICAKYQMPVPVRNAGIIHSHSSFPWQYPQEENCSLGLTTRDNHTLRFTVSKMDLFEADSLTVIGRAEEIPADDSNGPLVKRNSSESATQVKFVFDIKSFTLSGRGFVICYKFYNPSEPKVDVCKDITQQGTLTTTISEPATTLFGLLFPENTASSTTATPVASTKPTKNCKRKGRRKKKRCRPKGGDKPRGNQNKKNRKRRKKRKCDGDTTEDCSSSASTKRI